MVSVRFLARFVTLLIVRRAATAVVVLAYQACRPALVRRHNCCAHGPRNGPILVSPARYPRVSSGLAASVKPRKGTGMDTVRRYAMLIDGDWVDTEEGGAGRRQRSADRQDGRARREPPS